MPFLPVRVFSGYGPWCKRMTQPTEFSLRLRGVLGSGKQAKVLRVESPILSKDHGWVLKVFSGLVTDEDVRKNIKAECFGLKLLGRVYVVVDFEDKEGNKRGVLMERLYECQWDPSNVEDILKGVDEIWQAVKKLHKKKVVHSDLTPDNIKSTKNNNTVPIDFALMLKMDSNVQNEGSSCGWDLLTTSGEKKVTPNVDARALLVLIFTLLIGEHCGKEITFRGCTYEILDEKFRDDLEQKLRGHRLHGILMSIFDLMTCADNASAHWLQNRHTGGHRPPLTPSELQRYCPNWQSYLQRLLASRHANCGLLQRAVDAVQDFWTRFF